MKYSLYGRGYGEYLREVCDLEDFMRAGMQIGQFHTATQLANPLVDSNQKCEEYGRYESDSGQVQDDCLFFGLLEHRQD